MDGNPEAPYYFNPRLREGGDSIMDGQAENSEVFQSTPPRGRRRTQYTKWYKYLDFNPRLREGGDTEVNIFVIIFIISIHASAREATRHSD